MNETDNVGGYTLPDAQSATSTASQEQVMPADTFPREYILGVFIDLQDAQKAADALRAAGYGDQEIHVLEGADFVEAISHDQSPFNIVTSTSHDKYLLEARRGRSFLAVRPANTEQLTEIRDVLAPYGAYLVKYIDTWSQRDLLP